MPEFSVENLREMHTQLTAAGIVEYAGIAFDTIRLEARVDAARDTILTLKRERDTLREQANAAHAALDEAGAPACDGVLSGRITALAASLNAAVKERDSLRADLTEAGAANARLAGRLVQAEAENAPLRARRNALHDALARMGNALSAAGHHAGFGLDEVEQALAAALAERDTLRARLAECPCPPDHRDPPVETAAEATVRRLRNYLSQRTGFDYTSDRHADIDLVAVVSRGFHDAGQTVSNLQAQLERAERIAKEQFEHRLYRT